MTYAHSIATLVLDLLTTHLDLPPHTVQHLHRLQGISGDQARFIKAPPQPPEDRRTALGEHTDFGSMTYSSTVSAVYRSSHPAKTRSGAM